jgi:DNA-binding CsgD family transcriptional regulator
MKDDGAGVAPRPHDEEARLKARVDQVARNAARRAFRQVAKLRLLGAAGGFLVEPEPEMSFAVAEALSRLTKRQQKIVRLTFMGVDDLEIAALLDIHRHTVRRARGSAHQKLRRLLERNR